MGAVVRDDVTRRGQGHCCQRADALSTGWHLWRLAREGGKDTMHWRGREISQLTQAELQGGARHPYLCARPSDLVCRPLQLRAV